MLNLPALSATLWLCLVSAPGCTLAVLPYITLLLAVGIPACRLQLMGHWSCWYSTCAANLILLQHTPKQLHYGTLELPDSWWDSCKSCRCVITAGAACQSTA